MTRRRRRLRVAVRAPEVGERRVRSMRLVVGGFLGSLFTYSRVTDFNTAGLIGSVIGAVLRMFAAGGLMPRRALA
jgi:hypothetical protein